MKEPSQKFSSLNEFAIVTLARHSLYLKNVDDYTLIHSPYLIKVGSGTIAELFVSFGHGNIDWFNLIFDFSEAAEISTYWQGWYYVHKSELALYELMA